MATKNQLLGGSLIIAGTAIGAGMLALPFKTAGAGFIPTVIAFVLSWLYMTIAAFFVLETNLWMEEEANLVTMAKRTLGNFGEWVTVLSFLFLLYACNIAYFVETFPLLIESMHQITGVQLSNIQMGIGFTAVLGLIIYLGTGMVDYVNRFMMIGLFGTFIMLTVSLVPHTEVSHFVGGSVNKLWFGLPVIVSAFAYQFVIPSLKDYFHGDIKKLSQAIFIGSLVPLALYTTWIALIMGMIPSEGPNGLIAIASSANPVSTLVSTFATQMDAQKISKGIHYFAMFAFITSALGVTMSLTDLLSDGFKVHHKDHFKRFVLTMVAVVPPLVIALWNPNVFLIALGFAGVFIAILLGIIPALMVISGRYYKGYTGYRTPGGMASIIGVIVASLAVIGLHFWQQFFG